MSLQCQTCWNYRDSEAIFTAAMENIVYKRFKLPERRRITLLPRVDDLGWMLVGKEAPEQHVLQGLEFCFRLSDAGDCAEDEIEGVKHRHTFPHLMVKLPGATHRSGWKRSRSVFFIRYKPEALAGFASGGFDFNDPFREFRLTPDIQSPIDRLKECCGHLEELGVAEECDTLALLLIQRVLLSPEESGDEDPLVRIRKIASHQLASIAKPADFNELAAKYGFSRRNFYRCWRQVFPMPPGEFLNMHRMELAERLLVELNWQVGRIAEHLHYPGCSYFIQSFKRYFGTTPAAYRRARRRRDGESGVASGR